MTTSMSPSATAGSDCSGSPPTSSQRRSGAERSRAAMAGIASRRAADWKLAMRTRPVTEPTAAARPASARAASSSSVRAWSTSTSAGSVRRTPRPARSSNRTPVSRSSSASCWETADGVNCSASATAAMVPRSCSSRSRRSRRRSSIALATLLIHAYESEWLLVLRYGRLAPMNPAGSLLCLGSAAAFGAMAIFGKLAYDEGADAATLLAVRFTLAAAVLWVIVLAKGGLPRMTRRDVAIALALGACGYALQAGCYFLALERIDASLLSLLLYTFPAIVTVAAVALGRERLEGRRVTALALVSLGLTLVLAGAGTGAL